MVGRPPLRLLAGLIGLAALAAPGAAQETAPPDIAAPPPAATPDPLDQQQAETLGTGWDINDRMTVGVSIDGRGPYPFIIDTGAERTVISSELARTLALRPGRTATVHSMSEVSQIATVVIPALRVGNRSVEQIHAPALSRANLGASGILGVDTLQRERVTFDFRRRQMTVTPSRAREERWPDQNTVVVTGRSLYGRLVLVDASVDGAAGLGDRRHRLGGQRRQQCPARRARPPQPPAGDRADPHDQHHRRRGRGRLWLRPAGSASAGSTSTICRSPSPTCIPFVSSI